jgi:hypothetical protein
LIGTGRADIGFFWNGFVALTNWAALRMAVAWGVRAVAFTYLAITLIHFLLLSGIVQRLIRLRWPDYLKAIGLPSVSALLMGLMVALATIPLQGRGVSPPIQLLVLCLWGALVYTGLNLVSNRTFLRSVLQLLLPSERSS